mmetsp:Transcript_6944/g.8338  ORF Transcript_6944/g.8338 Transcript_6944/m.8338 type:complete len:122 (-) Transcript_6944:72-437(-)
MDFNMHGPGWFTIQYSGANSSKLSISPNITSDIYVSRGSSSDPNEFVYDMKFSGISSNVTLDADQLGLTSDAGYSVAVYCNAINETASELLYGGLSLFISAEGALTTSIAAAFVAIATLSA